MGDDPSDWPGPRRYDTNAAAVEAFAEFYRRDQPLLCGFVRILGASFDQARDVAQDAYAELWKSWAEIRSPRAWVRTVALRKWVAMQRGCARETAWGDSLDEISNTYAEPSTARYERQCEADRALRLLQHLPPRQRVVMAWTMDGYQSTEIARFTDSTPNAVRKARFDARTALKARLEREGGAE